jgi:hypothetical protein
LRNHRQRKAALDETSRRHDQRSDQHILVIGIDAQMRLRLGERDRLHRRRRG